MMFLGSDNSCNSLIEMEVTVAVKHGFMTADHIKHDVAWTCSNIRKHQTVPEWQQPVDESNSHYLQCTGLSHSTLRHDTRFQSNASIVITYHHISTTQHPGPKTSILHRDLTSATHPIDTYISMTGYTARTLRLQVIGM